MAFSEPGINSFKDRFDRDFPFAPAGSEDSTEYVRDKDISRAISSAGAHINQGFFGEQENFSEAFLLLTAHFLVMNLRAGAQGIRGGFSWLESSKSVGSVSTGVSIPPKIANNPRYSALSQTIYGGQYLMIIYPLLTGAVFSVCGGTRA